MKTNISLILICTISYILSFCNTNKAVYNSPEYIGRPPLNAFSGLVKLDNGEIRHYGIREYIKSNDNGLTWDTVAIKNRNLYGKQSPVTGEYIRLFAKGKTEVYSARSEGGIDGIWHVELIDSNSAIMLKPAVFVRNGTRALVGFHTRLRNGCGVYFSDDGGISWQKSNQIQVPPHEAKGFHKGQRWNHGAIEPSIVELSNGDLWMLIRNAQDNLYESFSTNAGETWTNPQPSRFYGTITMPNIQQLSSGEIICIWNNTTPLPELDHNGGKWEDVFTNRDALHAAVSKDDGKSWTGFREIYLNPLRNDSLMATRFGMGGSLDRSAHQSEFVELGSDEILISLGQHAEFRAMITLNINWLYETERYDDFTSGLNNWSVQKYFKNIVGHCNYNRTAGAFLVDHPSNPGEKVMHLKSEFDEQLLYQNSGALFNFPAGNNGKIKSRIKFDTLFNGLGINLLDRWFNPTDTVAQYYSIFNLEIPENLNLENDIMLSKNAWYDLSLEWGDLNKPDSGYCKLFINGNEQNIKIPPVFPTVNGISYIHFILPTIAGNNGGILIDFVNAEVW